MSLKIFEKFDPRANPIDGNYPTGSIKNETVPGANDGTPLDAEWGNDYVGFTDALLNQAGVTPSGNADTVVASDRLTALNVLAKNESNKGYLLADIIAESPLTLKDGQTRRITDRGNGLFNVVTLASLGGGPLNGFDEIELTGSPLLALVFVPVHGVSPAHMGAIREKTDQSASVQACFDYSLANFIEATGHGTYYVSSGVSLNYNFGSFATMTLEPLVTMVDVVTIDVPNVKAFGLWVRNGEGVANTHGIHIKKSQCKLIQCSSAACEKNIIVGSYSVELSQCRGTGGGTGLSVYGQSFSEECNALIVYGGEWFGTSDYSMYIGDDRLTSSIPGGEFFGNNIKLIGCTLDQGKLKADRVTELLIQCYCEKGGGPSNTAIELGGSFSNSLRGVTISNSWFADYDYYVKCLGTVSNLVMGDNHYRGNAICALYMTSDQFQYTYQNNTKTTTFTGQEVHTGIRSGISTGAWDNKTVDVYDLYSGNQHTNGEQIYPNKEVLSAGVRYTYTSSNYRQYITPGSATCTVAGATVTFDTSSDVNQFNAGDAVNFTGTGGALSYVLSVDYDAGTLRYDSGAWSGAGTISQQTEVPIIEYRSFQPSGSTSFRDGSVIWNIFTVDPTTIFWVLKSGVWTAHT